MILICNGMKTWRFKLFVVETAKNEKKNYIKILMKGIVLRVVLFIIINSNACRIQLILRQSRCLKL